MNKKPNHALMSETQRYAILGAIFGFTFPVVGTIVRILLSHLPINLHNMLQVQLADPLLWIIDTAPIVLGLFSSFAGHKQDLLTRINDELRDHEKALQQNQIKLEQSASEQNAELEIAYKMNERRAAQFEAIARISHTIGSTQALEILLPQITETISNEFNFYHVGIFLLDARKEYAVLVAANSEGGQRMLERGHRLLVGETGLVGFATGSGEPRIALDVGQDAVYFNNPDLPNTHSEAAMPLRFSGEVIGALDIQSTETNAFSDEDIVIFSALANQVSIAIQNARSYQQTREALAQAEAASSQLTGNAWQEVSHKQNMQGFTFDGVNVMAFNKQSSKPAASLAIPLTLRGARIGTLNLSASDPNRTWTDDEIVMAQAAAERTAIALESARLLNEAQRRAVKERTIGEISAKIGSLGNIENIIQTAIRELGGNLPNADITFQFTTDNNDKK